jgi:chorismate mutase
MSGARLAVIRWFIACVDGVLITALRCRMGLGQLAAREKRSQRRVDMVDPSQELVVFNRVERLSERLGLDSGFALCLYDEIIAQSLFEQRK